VIRTPGRVDVEPPSDADSLRDCAMTSPRAWQAAVDVVVDDVEDEVVEIFSSSCPSRVVEIFSPSCLCSLATLQYSLQLTCYFYPEYVRVCLSRNCFLLLGLDVYDLLFTLKLASDIFSCFFMDVRSDLVLI
jgi:hypothetical protein